MLISGSFIHFKLLYTFLANVIVLHVELYNTSTKEPGEVLLLPLNLNVADFTAV